MLSLSALVSCRGYSSKKIQENVQCEIMHCMVEEATESYRCAHTALEMAANASCVAPAPLIHSACRCCCCCCREEIVHVLQSSSAEEMEQNVERLTQWAGSWRPSS